MRLLRLSPFDMLLALVVAVLLCVPATYRVIRQQVPAPFALPIPVGHTLRQHGLPNPFPPHIDGVHDAALMGQEAALEPDDYHAQVAAALASSSSPLEVSAALRKLVLRFPNEPSLYAHLMAAEWRGSRLFRNLDPGAKAGKDAPLIPGDVEAVERFERYASAGERLDPDNAFFTFLRAAPLYALRRDSEARACILRTREQSRYDDYQIDGIRDVVRLRDRVFGWRSQIDRLVSYYSPHDRLWELTSSVAGILVIQAGSLEASGRRVEGCDLRLALAHYGGLMRVDRTWMVTSLHGCFCTSRAFGTGTPTPNVHPRTETLHERTERLIRQADAVLVRDGRPKMRGVVAAELHAGETVRACGYAVDRDFWLVPCLVWVVGLWILGATILFHELLQCLLQPCVRMDRTLDPGFLFRAARVMLWGILAASMGTFLNAVFGMVEPRTLLRNDPAECLALGVVGAVLTMALVGAAKRRIARIPARWRAARQRAARQQWILGGFHRLSVVIWIGIVIATAVMEAGFTRAMDLRMQGEGRYLSTVAHIQWPGPVSWPRPPG